MDIQLIGLIGTAIAILVLYAIQFRHYSNYKKLKFLIENEAKDRINNVALEIAQRKEQDWKLYNIIKSNFKVANNQKISAEEKVEQDDKWK